MSLKMEVIEKRLADAHASEKPYTFRYKAASGDSAEKKDTRYFIVTSKILHNQKGTGRYVRALEVNGPGAMAGEPLYVEDRDGNPIKKTRNLTVSGRILTIREGLHTYKD